MVGRVKYILYITYTGSIQDGFTFVSSRNLTTGTVYYLLIVLINFVYLCL